MLTSNTCFLGEEGTEGGWEKKGEVNKLCFHLTGHQRCSRGYVKRGHTDRAGKNVERKCEESCMYLTKFNNC